MPKHSTIQPTHSPARCIIPNKSTHKCTYKVPFYIANFAAKRSTYYLSNTSAHDVPYDAAIHPTFSSTDL